MINKNAYMVMGYACNEKCRCCPLSFKKERVQVVPTDELFKEAFEMLKYGVTDVTLSGGEPTIHPEFIKIVSFFLEKNINVHILSNGERFSDKSFADELIKLAKSGELTVTTTFHSHIPEKHEFQNGTEGSFQRSLAGLRYLDESGVCISIKHCITSDNYHELPLFMEFALNNFSINAELQMWGIDLCGLDEVSSKRSFIDFRLIGSHLQKAIDVFENYGRTQKQALTINNIPLCTCDCYYWQYFTGPEDDIYIDHQKNGDALEANSGPISLHCHTCPFRYLCMGAYFSAFEIFGDDIVFVPQNETEIISHRSTIKCYNCSTIDKIFCSPYTLQNLNRRGFTLNNRLTNGYAAFRLKSEQIIRLQRLLSNGVGFNDLSKFFGENGFDGVLTVNDLLRKGLIE